MVDKLNNPFFIELCHCLLLFFFSGMKTTCIKIMKMLFSTYNAASKISVCLGSHSCTCQKGPQAAEERRHGSICTGSEV